MPLSQNLERISVEDNLSALFVYPESFCMNLVEKLLQHFDDHGLRCLNVKLIDLIQEDQFYELYEIMGKQKKCPSWLYWRKFSLGPMIVILVGGQTKETIQTSLVELRKRFIPMNPVLDFFGETANLSKISSMENPIFTEKELYAAKELLKKSFIESVTLTFNEVFQRYLTGYHCVERFTSFHEVRFRIIHRLATSFARKFNLYHCSDLIFRDIVTGMQLSNEKIVDERIITSLNQKIQAQLSVVNKEVSLEDSLYTTVYLILIEKLLHYKHNRETSWLSLLAEVEMLGVRLSNWEKMVILSYLYTI